MCRLVFVAAAVLASLAGTAQAQGRLPGGHLVSIVVAEDPPQNILAHTIQIEAETPGTAQSKEELDHRVWRASRISERGQEEITSDVCPALRSAVNAFASLPPLTVSPPAMRVHAGPIPVPPTKKDGYSVRLSFSTLTSDGSEAMIEMRPGNAYDNWAHATISSLAGCWGRRRPAA